MEVSEVIEALRRDLGEDRFVRFLQALRDGPGDRLYVWQVEALDRLELRLGKVIPRDVVQLKSLLLPLLARAPTLVEAEVPAWITVDSLGGQCPVQAEGSADTARWYFRARWAEWSIGLTLDATRDPVDVDDNGEATFYHEELYGDGRYDAGYMPHDEARYFIVRELSRWRRTQAPQPPDAG